MEKTIKSRIISTLPGIILPLAVFLLMLKGFGIWGAFATALVSLLIYILGIKLWFDVFKSTAKRPIKSIETASKHGRIKTYGYIAAAILLLRIFTYIFTYIAALKCKTVTGNIISSFQRIWFGFGTDANHYVGIAKQWYVTQGDSMYHIVFFPFYPILTKLFSFITFDYYLASVIVSTLCSCAIGIAAYELALIDFDKKTALRFVKFIFIIPAAFFYFAPMTESLFVLLCLLCVLFARKNKWWLCALFGALASFTRSQGAILMLPCAIIATVDAAQTFRNRKSKKKLINTLIFRWTHVLAISLGLICYLLINYSVWGNAFQFSIFQKEHWYQELGFFGSTVKMIEYYLKKKLAATQVHNFFIDGSFKTALALWIPQLIYIFASLIIIILAARKLNSAYTAFFAAYFIISIGATWLLSAPRYLMACFPLPLGLAVLCKNKAVNIAATAVCVIASSAYLFMYAAMSPIY